MTLPTTITRYILFLVFFLVMLSSASGADMLIGGKTIVTTRNGDYLPLIGSRLGVDWPIIARENELDPKTVFKTGEQFSINNLRIVPKVIRNGIIINVPDRMLYFFKNGELATSFPVGLGLPQKEWQTPLGSFYIIYKRINPTWSVPVSIQKELDEKGQLVHTIVPPGKDNPLGRYALHTSLQNVLIHEAIRPTSVYRWRSHGCIRVNPTVMEGFFHLVEKGTAGEIIYQPVNVAVQHDRVFLQVSRDIYNRIPSMIAEVQTRIEERGLAQRVDWLKIQNVIKRKTGIAHDVTR